MFDLTQAASRKFVSKRIVKKPWNQGKSILEVGETHFTLSEDMCKELEINDGNVLTIFDKDEQGLYLANISNQIVETDASYHHLVGDSKLMRKDTLIVSLEKPSANTNGVNYYKSRRASNKRLLKCFLEDMVGKLGEYKSEGIADAPFPCIKITPVEVEEEVSEPQNVEATEQVVEVSTDQVW